MTQADRPRWLMAGERLKCCVKRTKAGHSSVLMSAFNIYPEQKMAGKRSDTEDKNKTKSNASHSEAEQSIVKASEVGCLCVYCMCTRSPRSFCASCRVGGFAAGCKTSASASPL